MLSPQRHLAPALLITTVCDNPILPAALPRLLTYTGSISAKFHSSPWFTCSRSASLLAVSVQVAGCQHATLRPHKHYASQSVHPGECRLWLPKRASPDAVLPESGCMCGRLTGIRRCLFDGSGVLWSSLCELLDLGRVSLVHCK